MTSASPTEGWESRLRLLGAVAIMTPLCAIIALPIAYVFYGSFSSAPPGAPGAGLTLENWRIAYTSATYVAALGNTVVLGVLVAFLALGLGAVLAWIVARTDVPGQKTLAILLVVPLLISNLITALAWVALAAPNAGFINVIVRKWTGVQTLFDIYSLHGIVLVQVLHYASFAFLALFAALKSIDASLEEASYMLGAGALRTSLSMTIPLIAPTLATTFLIIFIFVAENFAVPTLLGSPVQFQTLPTLIYMNMAVSPAQPTVAAASGTALLWAALAGTALQRRITRNAGRYVTVTGKGARVRIVRLGFWRNAAFAFVLLYLTLAVALPYLALIAGSLMSFLTANIKLSTFTFDNYRNLFTGDNVTPLVNSLEYSIGGGLGLTVLYLLVSFFLQGIRGRWSRLADYVTVIPSSAPALILGMGLIWTFVGWSAPIYGTWVILMIAYFLRNIGFGVRHADNALRQISGDLSEAARMAGASRLRAFLDISAPIVRPAILSLWTMLFIFIFTEVSATILLYTPATRTLPTVLWDYMGSGSQSSAFAIAVSQATLIFLILFLADRWVGLMHASVE